MNSLTPFRRESKKKDLDVSGAYQSDTLRTERLLDGVGSREVKDTVTKAAKKASKNFVRVSYLISLSYIELIKIILMIMLLVSLCNLVFTVIIKN